MASDSNQGQPNLPDPDAGYGMPQNSYGAPQNPYGAQNPYGMAPENPYASPAYGAPNYQETPGYMPPPPAPLPLGEAIRELPRQYIKVTTKPGVATLAEEMDKASWGIVWIQLIGLGIISTILGYLSTQVSGTSLNPTTGSGSLNPATLQMIQTIRSIALGASYGQIVLVPLFFFIWMGILYGVARAFGGQGRFVNQGYTYLLFIVPLGIVSSILGLIPIAGGLIAFAIGIYEIVLTIFSIMAVHRLPGGRATAVVLLPIGVLALLGCALALVFAALIVSAVQHP